MSEADAAVLTTTSTPVDGLQRLSWVRLLGVMVGLTASVALGVAVVLWSQAPSMSPLYPDLASQDAGEIMEALGRSNIPYKVDETTGLLMVPSARLHEARLKLAAQDLPKAASTGFEILQGDQGFGTSRFVERARYQHALEGELARTVVALNAVHNARVHLALPRNSVFVRDRKQPSASVVVDLYAGRRLQPEQVEAVVHLVASSVSELDPSRVTVVDQKGRVLSGRKADPGVALTRSQFEYTQRLEDHFRQRVENILAPVLGTDRVRAQVTADVDFTVTEQTQEQYNPDLPAMRSEQTVEEQNRLQNPVGIPGALSNQPPGAGQAPEVAKGTGGEDDSSLSTRRRSTRNFELDKTLSHSRLASGVLRRLSVAVVVDDRVVTGSDGVPVHQPLSGEEIQRLTTLVKQAVGFDTRRGDSVDVVNTAFRLPDPEEALPEVPLWQQPWVLDLARQVGAALLVLLLVFAVVRPTLRALVAKEESEPALINEGVDEDSEVAALEGPEEAVADDENQVIQVESSEIPGLSNDELALLEGPIAYEAKLELARRMVDDDPKRVAQLVKNWIAEND